MMASPEVTWEVAGLNLEQPARLGVLSSSTDVEGWGCGGGGFYRALSLSTDKYPLSRWCVIKTRPRPRSKEMPLQPRIIAVSPQASAQNKFLNPLIGVEQHSGAGLFFFFFVQYVLQRCILII